MFPKLFRILTVFFVVVATTASIAAPGLALAPRTEVSAWEYVPQVRVLADAEEVGAVCAREMADLLVANNAAERPTVFGLATGSTPLATYRRFIEICREERIDLSRLITFNLDEYRGLPPGHPESYREFMLKNFILDLVPLGFKLENFHILNGWAKRVEDLSNDEKGALDARFPQRESNESLTDEEDLFILNGRCREYERMIAKLGPVDLQLLGIGENGHIGFAEPGAPWDGKTAVVELTENTRQANARFFDGDLRKVPTHALSMGVGTILQARRIILLATGEKKADAIRKTLLGPLTPAVPASALRRHRNAEFLLDADAAELFAQKAPQVKQADEPVLQHWLKLWQTANGVAGKIEIQHSATRKPNVNGVFKTYGSMILGWRGPEGFKRLALFNYEATPRWEFGVTQQKINEKLDENFFRKRLMTLLYVYFLNRFQPSTVFNFTISPDGVALMRGLEKLGLLHSVTLFGRDPENAHAQTKPGRIRALATDPAQIFKTAGALADTSL